MHDPGYRDVVSLTGPSATTLALMIAATMLSGSALAEEPSAAARASHLYEQGTAAHERGEYLKAAKLFAKADDTLPDATALQAALSAVLLADDPVLAVRLAARADRNPYDQDMSAAAAAARSKFGHLVGRIGVRCKACRVRIDGGSAAANKPHWVLTGKHEVVIELGGKSQRRSVRVEAGSTVDVVPLMVELDKPKPPPSEPPEPAREGISQAWFWVGLGASALLGGATVLSAVDTATLHRDFEELPTESLASAGREAELRTNVLIGTTAGVAAVTATLAFFVDWSGHPTPVSAASRSGASVLPSAPVLPSAALLPNATLLPGGALLTAGGLF